MVRNTDTESILGHSFSHDNNDDDNDTLSVIRARLLLPRRFPLPLCRVKAAASTNRQTQYRQTQYRQTVSSTFHNTTELHDSTRNINTMTALHRIHLTKQTAASPLHATIRRDMLSAHVSAEACILYWSNVLSQRLTCVMLCYTEPQTVMHQYS